MCRRHALRGIVLLAVITTIGRVDAFTSKSKSLPTSGAGGVIPISGPPGFAVVTQGSQVDAPDALNFNDDGDPRLNGLRDSNEALKITFDSNLPGARLVIYTKNSSAQANPKYCDNPATGRDGGGLVGIPTSARPDACKFVVPLLWVVKDTNVDHQFTPAVVGDDEVYVVDAAHMRTLLPAAEKNTPLDNIATKFCDPDAFHPLAPVNFFDDGLYPQYFGGQARRLDICSDYALPTVIHGHFVFPGERIPEAEELSLNIAVVVYNIFRTKGLVPNLSTPDPNDNIAVTSPIYLPLAADYRTAQPGVVYWTSTFTIEILHQ